MTAALPATAGPSGPFLPPTGVGPVPQASDGADTAVFFRDLVDQVGEYHPGALADAIEQRITLLDPILAEPRQPLCGPKRVPARVQKLKSGAA